MIDVKLTDADIFVRSSTSKGTQKKYVKDGYWYKLNKLGYENIAEYLCSFVLECSNCKKYVSYEICKVNGKSACRSYDFLKPGQEFVTFQNLYEQYYGIKLTDKVMEFREISERIAYTLEFVKKVTKLDLTEYLKTILTLDMLCLNEDRHFDNLGVLYSIKDNVFTEAPVFDNGLSLCSDYGTYPLDEEIEEIVTKVTALPFSGSFELQAAAIGFGLKIDYQMLYRKLDALESEEYFSRNRAIKMLRYQLDRYRKVLSKDES